MESKILRLNLKDVSRGAVTAVVAAVVFTLGGVMNQTGFDLFSADWGIILTSSLNAAVAAFIGYLGKNLMTDSEGTLHLGVAKIKR